MNKTEVTEKVMNRVMRAQINECPVSCEYKNLPEIIENQYMGFELATRFFKKQKFGGKFKPSNEFLRQRNI